MDAELSKIDKYYVKTKHSRQQEMQGVRDESYEMSEDYFSVLQQIKQDYQKLSKKYSEDILPSLLNGLHYLFSKKRKNDYMSLMALLNTIDAFVEEVNAAMPEIVAAQVQETREQYENQRIALLRTQKRSRAEQEQNYQIAFQDLAIEMDERITTLLPKEQVDRILNSVKRYQDFFGNVCLEPISEDSLFYMGVLSYPIADFVRSPTLSSFIMNYCASFIQNGCLRFPIFSSASSALPLFIRKDNSSSGAVKHLMQSVIFSFLSTTPVSHLKLTILDCENHGNSVDSFFDFRRRMPEIFGAGICTDLDDALIRLRELSERIDRISQDQLGGQYASLFDYVEKHPDSEYTIEFLVAFDFPKGLSEQSLPLMKNILLYGPRCGVYTILSESAVPSASMSQEFMRNYAELLNICIVAQQQGEQFFIRNLPCESCVMPDRNTLNTFLSKYMLIQESIRNRGIAFPELLSQLLNSKSEEDFSHHLSDIQELEHFFQQGNAEPQKGSPVFPDYIMLGYTQYPLDLFSEQRSFEKLCASFHGKSGYLSFPLILNLEKTNNLMLEYFGTQPNSALDFAYHTIWSFFSALPPTRLNVCIFDPDKRGGNALPFLDFKKACPSSFDENIYTDSEAMQERLNKLNTHINQLIQDKLGNRCSNLLQYNRRAPTRAEPFTLLVIFDFPNSFDSRSMERLQSVLRNGGQCGVFTILCHNQDMMPFGYDNCEERISELKKLCTLISCKNHFSMLPFNLPIVIPAPLSHAGGERFIAQYASAMEAMEKRGIAFADILDSQLFSRNIDKQLAIPIGIGDEERTISLEFGKGSSHHALIAGGTGSGKTELFHSIILSSMLHFSPDQLYLYLMDFKGGTGFKIYETHRLPHIKLLALDAMQEFGEGILEELVEELDRRSTKFKKAGVDNLSVYNQKASKPIPRILVIMDEFQILFNDATNRKVAFHCAELAKRIVTEGRSYGIHLIMATQSTKILTNLTLESGTVEQMRIRIGLKCTEADARYLFPNTDLDALEQMKGPVGTAVLNEEFTEQENIGLRVAYCDDETKSVYLEKIAQTYHSYPTQLQVFEGNRVTSLLEVQPQFTLCRDMTVSIAIGMPIKVAPPHQAIFDRRNRRNTLICGANEEMMENLCNLYTLGILRNEQARLFCFDGEVLLQEKGSPAYLAFSRFGNRFSLAQNRQDILHGVHDLYDTYTQRRKNSWSEQIFVFLKSLQFLDIVQAMLKRELLDESDYMDEPTETPVNNDPFDFGTDYGESSSMSVSDKLLKLINDGSAYEINFIVSAADFQTVKDCMYFGENTLSKFPERYVFSISDNDAEVLADGVSLAGMKSNTVVYTNSKRKTFQLKPYAFPNLNELQAYLNAGF